MKSEIFNELRKIRTELTYGKTAQEPENVLTRLAGFGLSVPVEKAKWLISSLFHNHAPDPRYVPPLVIQTLRSLLDGQQAEAVCDPWAGIGAVVSTLLEVTKASRAFALTPNREEAAVGQILASEAKWHVGDPIELLASLSVELDIVASVPPLGARTREPVSLSTVHGSHIEIEGDLGQALFAAAAQRLRPNGTGIFVAPASFFFSERSILYQFGDLQSAGRVARRNHTSRPSRNGT